MNPTLKEFKKQKHQFKAQNYCPNCQQKKSCGLLDKKKEYCCSCYQKIWEELEEEQLLIKSAQIILNDYRSRVITCQCLGTEKPRIVYVDSDGSGWSKCEGEQCDKTIKSAGHHRVIKNRNNPKFWGLEVEEQVLCGNCLEAKKEIMTPLRRAKFNEYKKLKRL